MSVSEREYIERNKRRKLDLEQQKLETLRPRCADTDEWYKRLSHDDRARFIDFVRSSNRDHARFMEPFHSFGLVDRDEQRRLFVRRNGDPLETYYYRVLACQKLNELIRSLNNSHECLIAMVLAKLTPGTRVSLEGWDDQLVHSMRRCTNHTSIHCEWVDKTTDRHNTVIYLRHRSATDWRPSNPIAQATMFHRQLTLQVVASQFFVEYHRERQKQIQYELESCPEELSLVQSIILEYL